MEPVGATYRLQLHQGFPLRAARDLVPYLNRLGVTHLYLSPILRARAGSTHGYDVVDPTILNPELGTESELAGLVDALRDREMGIVLDIVPNHMATGPENPFWEDVLAHGHASPYAAWFDIDWRSPDRPGRARIVLPVLGDRLGRVLARGELRLGHEEGGRFRVRYFDQSFPLDPATLPPILSHAVARLREGPDARGSEPTELTELERLIRELANLPPRRAAGARGTPGRKAAADRALTDLARLAKRSASVRDALDRAALGYGEPGPGAERLRSLLERQAYRLAYWRRGAREINYRRFFTLSHLVTLRQEDPEVFAATHRRVLDWIEAGWIDGLRIDHVDGLWDPRGYLERLRAAVDRLSPDPEGPSLPIYVEKILARHEPLRRDWPVEGTTGYEFLVQAEDLFLEPDGYRGIETAYRGWTRRSAAFGRLCRDAKRRVLDGPLGADLRRLAGRLARLDPAAGRDPDPGRQRSEGRRIALRETIAALSVYRTYVGPRAPYGTDLDERLLSEALAGAREAGRADDACLDELEAALRVSDLTGLPEETRRRRLAFIQRFQQLSGPAAAKGVEDTAFYVHVPLVSRNEVGGEPDAPLDDAPTVLHDANADRAESWPRALLAASTHDTKRSADVRARLDVLSELPDEWTARFRRWHRWNREHRRTIEGRAAPDRNTEYLLYQTLVGIWPVVGSGPSGDELPSASGAGTAPPPAEPFRRRVEEYMLKAVREAKRRTSWTDPDEAFELAVRTFVRRILSPQRADRFLRDLHEFATRVARVGLWNSLSRTLVQLTAPGVPDIYRGDELWNFSLVDPDNRRPVDFAARRAALAECRSVTERPESERRAALRAMSRDPHDGRVKLHLTWTALSARDRGPDVFVGGRYRALEPDRLADNLFAFARLGRGAAAVTVVPRRVARLVRDSREPPVGVGVWGEARILFPDDLREADLAEREWRCAFTGRHIPIVGSGPGAGIPVAEALSDFPAALLTSW